MKQIIIPKSKKASGKIMHFGDFTGNNGDLDEAIHKGFTIGNGKKMYWNMICHRTGNYSVCSAGEWNLRWIPGSTIITIHFK